MAKADGSVLIITEIDSDGVAKETKKIKGTLEDLGQESQRAGKEISGGLADSFKKLGEIIAAAGIADKIIDVGKEAAKLGSDLQEVQNVVDVTFSTMSSRVDEFAKAAQRSAGLSETMAKKYVGTFGAMADSFGFAESEAYEMSTALTQLAGDLASFYNISQDEAYTKLKSVFTGETESLKELGVVMTQTALDAYAMANGFGKVTSEMTEQEKVALRYQFVMDQLSSASGDFARTQESWANQTRALQLQWESLLAVIGGGLIREFTPALQFITEDVMPALTDLATAIVDAFKAPPSEALNKSLKGFEKTLDKIDKGFEATTQEIEKSAIMAAGYRDKLEELEEAGLDTEASQRQYAAVVEKLNEIYPELNLSIDEQTGLLDDQSKARLKNIDAMKKEALYQARAERYSETLEAQAEAILNVEDAEKSLAASQAEREQIEKMLTKATGLSVSELKKLYNAQKTANSALKAGGEHAQLNASMIKLMSGETATLTEEQMDLVEQVVLLSKEEERLTQAIDSGNAAISEQDEMLQQWNDEMGLTADKQESVAEGANTVSDAVEGMTDAYESASDAAEVSMQIQIGLFDKLAEKSDLTAAEIIQNWRDQQVAFSNYADNLRDAVNMGLDEALVKELADGSREHMLILEELVNYDADKVDELNRVFRDRLQIEDLTEIQMAAAQGVSAQKLQQMLNDFQSKWPAMSAVVKKEVAKIQSEIDSISGKTFYIKAQSIGGISGGRPIFPSTPDTASLTSVPMLARGAVIPPSKPFLAMLGDQKSGTNVEAPLETIQEALANVLAEQGGSGDINIVLTGDMAQLARVLKPYIDAESTRKGRSLAKVVITDG